MRIHYLSNSDISLQQANLVHVAKMTAAWTVHGHDTHLFVAGASPPSDAQLEDRFGLRRAPMVHCHSRPAGRMGQFRYGLRVRAAHAVLPEPDLLYARNPVALLFLHDKGWPFIYEAHAVPRSGMRRRVERYLLSRPHCLGLVAITQALLDDLGAIYPELADRKSLVAPDGADLPDSGTDEPEIALPRRPGALQAGYVGSLLKGKGVEQIADLAPAAPDVDFHIVGGTREQVARWRARTAAPNLHFHGYVDHGALGGYYRQFDVALAPVQQQVLLDDNRTDIARWTSPLKIFEYMAHGLPVLASDLPVLREVLRPGDNAILCPPTDIEAWRAALTRLRDHDERRRLGAKARADVAASLSWSARSKKILDAFCPAM